MWENTVITNAGLEMLSGMLAGEKVKISSVKSGAGAVDVSELRNQTEVITPKQTAAIQGLEKNGDFIQLSVLFTNQGLTTSYGMRQIGVYVQGEDQKDILFAISQSNTAKEIPSGMVTPWYSLLHHLKFQFKNDIGMEAVINPAGLVSMEEYRNTVERVNTLERKRFLALKGY